MKIVGIKPVNSKYENMKTLYDACISNNLILPSNVSNYFEGKEPNKKGVTLDLSSYVKKEDNKFVIDLNSLPSDVKAIHFIRGDYAKS